MLANSESVEPCFFFRPTLKGVDYLLQIVNLKVNRNYCNHRHHYVNDNSIVNNGRDDSNHEHHNDCKSLLHATLKRSNPEFSTVPAH